VIIIIIIIIIFIFIFIIDQYVATKIGLGQLQRAGGRIPRHPLSTLDIFSPYTQQAMSLRATTSTLRSIKPGRTG